MLKCVVSLAIALSLLSSTSAYSGKTSWIGGDGSWEESSHWSGGVVPGYDMTSEYPVYIDSNIVNYSIDNIEIPSLFIGGESSNAKIAHDNGELNVSYNFNAAYGIDSSAEYTLNNGFLGIMGHENIGQSGNAVFIHSNGDHYVKETLSLGLLSGSSGEYRLAGGTLWTGNSVVGNEGVGTFVQTGGRHFVGIDITDINLPVIEEETHSLTIGAQGGQGAYHLASGELHIADEIVGAEGSGELALSGAGFNKVYRDLVIGQGEVAKGSVLMQDQSAMDVAYNTLIGDSGGTGTLEIRGDSTLRVSDLTIGSDSDGSGTGGEGRVVQTGSDQEDLEGEPTGGVFVSSSLSLGQRGASGTYELNSGVLRVEGSTRIGDGGSGSFTQNGGRNVAGDLVIGASEGGQGLYALNDGFLQTNRVGIGSKAEGAIIQTGGTHEASALTVGEAGTYEMRGGALRVVNSIDNMGVFKLTGGSVSAGSSLQNFGMLSGTGSIDFADGGGLSNLGIVAPGSSPGVLSIGGNFIQEPGGTLQIELGGVDWHDILQVKGEAQLLGGDVFISFWDNFAPQDGMSFDFLHAEQGGRGEFESVYGPEGWIWELAYMDIDTNISGWEVVQLTARSVSSPVPEPTTFSLLGLGILALAGMRRRRLRTGES